MTTITREQAHKIIDAADEVITALAGTNDDVHPDNSRKMCDLWDDLNDRYAPPEVVRELARVALASQGAKKIILYRERNPYNGLTTGWEELTEQEYEIVKDNASKYAEFRTVYTAPPAPVVPEDISNAIETLKKTLVSCHRYNYCSDAVKRLEDACRAAMLQGAGGKPELTVWYGAMPETNGKTNWTAMLHRKGQHPWEGITIDRSEYPDRVRYEADRMRHLIGELADEPDILAYDADAHSGYVEPVSNRDELPDIVGWIRSDYHSDRRMGDAPIFILGCVDPSDVWGVKYIPLTGNYPVIPDGYVLVPIVPTEDMIINGFESEPDPHFSDEKEWEEYKSLSGCRQAARRAELCWAAMIKTAPKKETL